MNRIMIVGQPGGGKSNLARASGDRTNRRARADALIVLEMPFWKRVWRVFFRTLRYYGHTRPDLPDDCPERFEPEFWRWIWNTRHTWCAMMLALIPEAENKRA